MITDTVALVSNLASKDFPVGWATVALAVATVILAVFNWLMIRQMKEARKASERPGLCLWSVPSYVDDKSYQRVRLNVQNGGKGPVEDAKIECWLESQRDRYVYFSYGALAFSPGERRRVDCLSREDSRNPPKKGDLVIQLRWRGAKPWWDKWQSKLCVLKLDEMIMYGTKFESLGKASLVDVDKGGPQ